MGVNVADLDEFLRTAYCPEPDVLTRTFKWRKELDGDEEDFDGDETLRNTLKDKADVSYAVFATTMATEAGDWWTDLRTSVFVGSTEYNERTIVHEWCRDDLCETP